MVTITGIKPQTPFGVPEFFVQKPGHAPRTHWRAMSAMENAVALGLDPDEAWKQIVQAIKVADPVYYEKHRVILEEA